MGGWSTAVSRSNGESRTVHSYGAWTRSDHRSGSHLGRAASAARVYQTPRRGQQSLVYSTLMN